MSKRKEIIGKHITYSGSSTTIRITKVSWDQLRRVKFELSCESYSQGIVFLYALSKGNLKEARLKGSSPPKHKFPEEDAKPLSESSKTIVISKHAYDVFDKLREDKDHTYSTAITYLYEIFQKWIKTEDDSTKYFNRWISVYEELMEENRDLDLENAIQRTKTAL